MMSWTLRENQLLENMTHDPTKRGTGKA